MTNMMTPILFIATYVLTFSAGMCFATGLIKFKKGERKKAYIDFFNTSLAIFIVALTLLAP
jgi:uncharacterized membrane protein SpoIIM required for sporulation